MTAEKPASKPEPAPLPKYIAVFRTATHVIHNGVPTADERLHTAEVETLDKIMQVIKMHADYSKSVNITVSPLVLYTAAALDPNEIVTAANAVLARPAKPRGWVAPSAKVDDDEGPATEPPPPQPAPKPKAKAWPGR